MLGYMEQSVATALTKALTAVGCFKPKYPFVDAKKSALLYIAYHLKGKKRISENMLSKNWFIFVALGTTVFSLFLSFEIDLLVVASSYF